MPPRRAAQGALGTAMTLARCICVMMLLSGSLELSGCHCVHTPDTSLGDRPGPVGLQNDHEMQVRALITDLWTSDSQLENEALWRSKQLVDERVANALIGKLWETASYTPFENYAVQLMLDGIRAQGYSVEVTPTHYVVKSHPEARFPPPIPHPPLSNVEAE